MQRHTHTLVCVLFSNLNLLVCIFSKSKIFKFLDISVHQNYPRRMWSAILEIRALTTFKIRRFNRVLSGPLKMSLKFPRINNCEISPGLHPCLHVCISHPCHAALLTTREIIIWQRSSGINAKQQVSPPLATEVNIYEWCDCFHSCSQSL